MLCECCFAWILWKLGRIDGDPVLRETRIWATWEYVSSVGGYVVVDRENNFSILTTCTGKKHNSHVHFGGRN